MKLDARSFAPKSTLLAGIAFVILALLTVVGKADTVHAGTFSPALTIEVQQPDAYAASNFTGGFDLPLGDVNFAGVVAFIPGGWTITPGDEIPIGAVIGQLTSQATLGLINAPCSNELPVAFTMLNASLDNTDTIDFEDTDDNNTEDFAEDKNGDGLQDAIDRYPSFINRVLTDENDEPLQPIRRSAGITVVAGANVLLQFLVFDPGTFINKNIPNDLDLGYPSVTLLQNIGDPDAEPEPGVITDFCTPLTTLNTTFGVSQDNACTDANTPEDELDPVCETTSAPLETTGEGGTDPDEGDVTLLQNPAEGTHTFTTIAFGLRDADNDGLENTLDTCPFDANVGDPRVGGDGDADTDGLDAACDPNDTETNSDQDLDGYLNRQDNCPLVANGQDQADIEGVGNQEDSDVDEDGDDATDQIGDACDTNPDSPDGELLSAAPAVDVVINPSDLQPPDGSGGDGDGNGASEDDDDDGSSAVIFIIIGVVAGVVVVGGGAFFLMRGRGGGAPPTSA